MFTFIIVLREIKRDVYCLTYPYIRLSKVRCKIVFIFLVGTLSYVIQYHAKICTDGSVSMPKYIEMDQIIRNYLHKWVFLAFYKKKIMPQASF